MTFEVKNTSPVQQIDGKATNTMSVSEQGEVSGTPNILYLTLTIAEDAKTTSEAQKQTNKKLNTIKDILAKQTIPEKNITSTNISLSPKYQREDSKQLLIGYTSTHSIRVKIIAENNQFEKAWIIIDKVSLIENARIDQIQYDIEDKTPLQKMAREQAFNKAKAKAQELALLGDIKLGKVLSIIESSNDYNPPTPIYAKMEVAMDSGWGENTQVSVGQMNITTTISLVFEIN